MTQVQSEKKIPSAPNRGRTYDLLINPSDALSLSYRRLVAGLAVNYVHSDKLPI